MTFLGMNRCSAVVVVLVAAATGCGGGHDTTSAAASPGLPASSAAPPAAASPAAPDATAAHAAAPPPSASATEAAPSGALASLGWLVGSWSGTGADGSTIEETWTVDAAALKGAGRVVGKDGKERRELMRIEARGDEVVLVAQPDGAAAPTEFPLDARTSGPTHAQFVNDGHDWPTRIRYAREGDTLKIRVRGRPGQADESSTLQRR